MISAPPLVSIITPVFNGAKYIEELILSAKHQDYPNIEHIIIDDGSDDGDATVSILKKYPHLRWWSRENRGQYATMNEGLDAARGDILCFISADDVMKDGAVRLVINNLQDQTEIAGVVGDYDYIDENGQPIFPLRPFRYMPIGFYPYSLHIAHSSIYIRKMAIIQKGLYFDPSLRYVGDYDWIVRILSQSLCLKRIHKSLTYIRRHSEQASDVNFTLMRAEGLMIQKRLGVSAFYASIFRKIMFVSRVLTLAREKGPRQAFELLNERIKSS